MTELSMAEKQRATKIEKYGSIEAYNQQRYNDPSKAEQRKKVASLGGRSVPAEKRHFSNPKNAQLAINKRWKKKHGES